MNIVQYPPFLPYGIKAESRVQYSKYLKYSLS